MQIKRLPDKRFEVTHNGILIEICENIGEADGVINVCPDDYIADFEGEGMFRRKGLVAHIEQNGDKVDKEMSFSHKDPQQMRNMMESYGAKPRQTFKRADNLVNDRPVKWVIKCYTHTEFRNRRTEAVTEHVQETLLKPDGKATLAELMPAINAQRDEDAQGRKFVGFKAECICIS